MGAYGPSMMETLAALRPGERRHPLPRPWPPRPAAAAPAGHRPPPLEDDPDVTLEIDAPPEPRFAPDPPLGAIEAAPPPPAAVAASPPPGVPPAAQPPRRAVPPLPPLELPGTTRPPAAPAVGEPEPPEPLSTARALLLVALALVALLALGTLWWIEWRPAAVTTAALSAMPPATAPPTPSPAPPAQDSASEASGTSLAASAGDPAPADGAFAEGGTQVEAQAPAASTPAPVLTASAARRECMAQVETARLFLQIAHESENFSYYAQATRPEVERIVATRPVGPKTVAGIADHMWERRNNPERSSGWWSSQFSQCTQARMSGNWYVVRG